MICSVKEEWQGKEQNLKAIINHRLRTNFTLDSGILKVDESLIMSRLLSFFSCSLTSAGTSIPLLEHKSYDII